MMILTPEKINNMDFLSEGFISIETDFELLECKLKPWQLSYHYENFDLMGVLNETDEIMETFNTPQRRSIMLNITNMFLRRIHRPILPYTTFNEMVKNLFADPGDRIKHEQLGVD